MENNPERIKFIISYNDELKADKIITYNEILDYLEQERQSTEDGEPIWRFKRIIGHQGPLKPNQPDYKGSAYNVQVE